MVWSFVRGIKVRETRQHGRVTWRVFPHDELVWDLFTLDLLLKRLQKKIF